MVQIATIKLLRKLQEEGYTMLVSRRYAGRETDLYVPEKGDPQRIADSLCAMPFEEDQALSISEALRWMTDDDLKKVCVITSV